MSLPDSVERALDDFVASARQSFEGTLRSVVLFGSAAEGQLRATSDVNLVVVLARFDAAQAATFHGPLKMAAAAIRASVMFLREDEIGAATEAFAVKFGDIGKRRRVLWGDDVLAGRTPSREAMRRRAQQTLLNMELRLRERFVLAGDDEMRLALVVAESAGPLRAAAAAIVDLEGRAAESPKAALAALVAGWPEPGWATLLQQISDARRTSMLPPGTAKDALLGVIELSDRLQRRLEELG